MAKDDKNDLVLACLTAIRDNDPARQVQAEAVVEAASDVRHPMHSMFEWDDTIAAHKYRIDQARHIIARCRVLNPEDSGPKVIPAFVSLDEDRKFERGGYRDTLEVKADPVLREQLLKTALKELESYKRRHAMLIEIVGPIDRLIKRVKKENGIKT